MTTMTREEQKQVLIDTANHIINRDNTSPYSENLRELARIALASLEAEPVAWMRDDADGREYNARNEFSGGGGGVPLYATPPVPVVPEEKPMPNPLSMYAVDAVAAIAEVRGWNACRAAMLQSGNFRENKNSSTNNFREIAETSTNYPVIPSEVLSAILKVAKIRADFDDFDGDRRGIGDCLDEAEQELIVTINKYASQLAAEPIATNDVREQTAVPPVPVIQADVAQAIEKLKRKLVECNRYNYCADAVKGVEYACHAAMLHSAEPASNHEELPLDYLQGQKDGLEWAAQLAEANHPQTGDWLYDDPLELAKAIRKGPDMPEFDGPTPITPEAIENAIEYIRSIAFHIDEDDYHGKHIAYFMRQALVWLEGHSCSDDRQGKAENQPVRGNQAAESNRGNEWTGNPDIDNAIIMLDRIDTLESCDDDRIEVVKTVLRRLAGNYPVTPDGWISCSERMPENIPGSCKEYLVFDGLNNKVHHDYWVVPDGDSEPVASFWNHYGAHVTHWMPLPEPPQEAK